VTSAPGEGSCFRLTLAAGVVTETTSRIQTGGNSVPAVTADGTGR